MKDKYLERTIGLIGEENLSLIKDKTILLVGLGGVGGSAFESLIRSGFNNVIIVDFDKVSESNLNRQLLYKESDIGLRKATCAKRHALEIDDSLNITAIDMKLDENLLEELDKYKIDFIIDAIDDVPNKIRLIEFANKNNIPYIMSLGMANRFDPTKVEITRLDKTTNDPLARKIRYECKKRNIDTKSINVSYSKEIPQKNGEKLYSIFFSPNTSGISMVYYVLMYFINK